jgi:putative glycosyltransferase (TIGR04348 family)
MQIQMICPAPAGSLYGNRITAVRWARILRELGHRLTISREYAGEPCDLLLALHAYRSADAVLRFRAGFPERPAIIALTGTDVYRDIHRKRKARKALELADRLVLLQPLAREQLAPHLRAKARVIYQSSEKTGGRISSPRDSFDVCVLGHLRWVKDPFRAALASRMLPKLSRVSVLHAGKAMEPEMAERARAEERRNPRYRWLGELPRARARQLIAQSRLLVLSSRMEGGANVISEAVVDGVPVLASSIPGSVGLLGKDYPGYFPVGDTEALARLLARAESDRGFYAALRTRCARLAPMFAPARERRAWRELIRELQTPILPPEH